MRVLSQMIATAVLFAAMASTAFAADSPPHRVAMQVDQNDVAVMNLALGNATNIMEHYKARGETVEIEIVAYGPGLNMLRADTSPVQDRIKQLAGGSPITFSACNNTKAAMEKTEGKAITLIPQATVVPSGAVRLIELQEQGWAYLRP